MEEKECSMLGYRKNDLSEDLGSASFYRGSVEAGIIHTEDSVRFVFCRI